MSASMTRIVRVPKNFSWTVGQTDIDHGVGRDIRVLDRREGPGKPCNERRANDASPQARIGHVSTADDECVHNLWER